MNLDLDCGMTCKEGMSVRDLKSGYLVIKLIPTTTEDSCFVRRRPVPVVSYGLEQYRTDSPQVSHSVSTLLRRLVYPWAIISGHCTLLSLGSFTRE
jgi:hypothetical protein